MPISRLRALSAWSKAGHVFLEGKFAAVGVLEPPAIVPQVAEQLQHQRAGEPHGVERIGAAHVVELGLERRDGDRAGPAPVALLARPADLGPELQALAAGAQAPPLRTGAEVF